MAAGGQILGVVADRTEAGERHGGAVASNDAESPMSSLVAKASLLWGVYIGGSMDLGNRA